MKKVIQIIVLLGLLAGGIYYFKNYSLRQENERIAVPEPSPEYVGYAIKPLLEGVDSDRALFSSGKLVRIDKATGEEEVVVPDIDAALPDNLRKYRSNLGVAPLSFPEDSRYLYFEVVFQSTDAVIGGGLFVFDTQTGKFFEHPLSADMDDTEPVAVSPDGKFVLRYRLAGLYVYGEYRDPRTTLIKIRPHATSDGEFILLDLEHSAIFVIAPTNSNETFARAFGMGTMVDARWLDNRRIEYGVYNRDEKPNEVPGRTLIRKDIFEIPAL